MKKSTLWLLIFCLFFMVGCAPFPTEYGVWKGRADTMTLYDDKNNPVPALCINILPNQIHNQFVGSHPVLVDKHTNLIALDAYVGKIIKVAGRIVPDDPINPTNKSRLSLPDLPRPADLPESNWNGGQITYVIKISPKKIKILSHD